MKLREFWSLDPETVFLNHGSFGATPNEVLEYQSQLRAQIERQPVRFFVRDLEALWSDARDAAASFVGCDAKNIAFVANATTGVNAVLRSLRFDPDEEILITSHEYNACKNVAHFVANRDGANVRVVDLPYPIEDRQQIIETVVDGFTDRTRLLLIDHVTSQTGCVLPIKEIITEATKRGIETLVDGAHAPGMIDLHLRSLGATYYTGNFHKWVCSPKSGAFLYVASDRRNAIRPTTISHGANQTYDDPEDFFHGEFSWTGTRDPTPLLAIPKAIEVMQKIADDDWSGIRARNRQLCLRGREILCDALGQTKGCPDDMVGSLATVRLPDGMPEKQSSFLYLDPMQNRLLFDYGIEVPIIPFPASPKRLLRISAQLYNTESEYIALANALRELL